MELFAVVGAVWASRTMFHAGVPMNGGATNASKLAQITVCMISFFSIVIIVIGAMVLCMLGMKDSKKYDLTD